MVYFYFDQICKVDFLDVAKIEISIDNGGTWNALTGNEYQGGAINFATLGIFTSSSYGNDWLPGNATAIPEASSRFPAKYRFPFCSLGSRPIKWITEGLPVLLLTIQSRAPTFVGSMTHHDLSVFVFLITLYTVNLPAIT